MGNNNFAPDYVDVAERIREFRAKHPNGCLRPADPTQPFQVVTIGAKNFIAVVAAAYRTPDDPCPGVGMAYEPVPGATSFTRDSELQNAETSAWGRAIMAVGAADARRVASADEVRNREADRQAASDPEADKRAGLTLTIQGLGASRKMTPPELAEDFKAWVGNPEHIDIRTASVELMEGYAKHLQELVSA